MAADAFDQWVTTIGSAVFAIRPGVEGESHLG